MRSFFVGLALLGACSSGPFVNTAHTPLPVVAGHAKNVIAQPQIVTITFPGYPFAEEVQGFGDFVGGSKWLEAVGSEYGVGAATHVGNIVWPTAAVETTDQGLRKLLGNGITDGTLPAPSSGKSSLVYTVYWPSSVVLDASGQGAGVLCQRGSFHAAGGTFTAGYHDSFTAPDGTRVAYAVVGDCSESIEQITTTASRELIGAFTNPFEFDNSGWLLDVPTTDPWFMNTDSGEVGYLCERELAVREGSFALHRSWSNAAAMAATQPCLPSPEGTAYYNVSASPATTVRAAAGTTVVYMLIGWSSEPVSPWELVLTKPEGSDFSLADLAPTLGASTIDSGRTTTLTLHVPASAKAGQLGGLDVMSGPQQHAWPVAFEVQ